MVHLVVKLGAFHPQNSKSIELSPKANKFAEQVKNSPEKVEMVGNVKQESLLSKHYPGNVVGRENAPKNQSESLVS